MLYLFIFKSQSQLEGGTCFVHIYVTEECDHPLI